MSHPPETSLSSWELVEALSRLSPVNPGLRWLDDAKALIEAWVRVREARMIYLIEKWRKPVASSTAQNEAVYNHCADDLESALSATRKQLKEKGESA